MRQHNLSIGHTHLSCGTRTFHENAGVAGNDPIGMGFGTTLIWHRRDLRLHDNALYQNAGETASRTLLSVYIFDPAQFARVPSCAQLPRCHEDGPHAAALLLKAVAELRSQLRAQGGDLLVRHGDPASCRPISQESTRLTRFAGMRSQELRRWPRPNACDQPCGEHVVV